MMSKDTCSQCPCRRSRFELNTEQQRRMTIEGRGGGAAGHKADPEMFFAHMVQGHWVCTDCDHPTAFHYAPTTATATTTGSSSRENKAVVAGAAASSSSASSSSPDPSTVVPPFPSSSGAAPAAVSSSSSSSLPANSGDVRHATIVRPSTPPGSVSHPGHLAPPPPPVKDLPPVASAFTPGMIVYNKASKSFARVIDPEEYHATLADRNAYRAVAHPKSPMVFVVPYMHDTPNWKPWAERQVESCDPPVLAQLDPTNDEQVDRCLRVQDEDEAATQRFNAGERVCPQPPCPTCGHYFCFQTDEEDPSDLGGWDAICCSPTCDCRFCTMARSNYTRGGTPEHVGCCKCYRKLRTGRYEK